MEYIDLRKLNTSKKKQVHFQVERLKKASKTDEDIEGITGVRRNRISEYGQRIKITVSRC
jgi:hypothetical protein